MEIRDINQLKANPKNPRQISREDYNSLVRSIKEFGDLSCIVFNIRTGQLVGGHQRTQAFKALQKNQIVITGKYEPANKQGTTAIGYVEFDGERFPYREVDWDESREVAANIAANRIQGQFDLNLLAEVTYELSQLENGADLLAATGQSEDEIKRLLAMVGVGPADDDVVPEDAKKELVCPNCKYHGEKQEFSKDGQ